MSVLVFACLPVNAQSNANLKDVVVTASRTEQSVSDVLADISVIDRAQIEASGATNVPQLLARLPGLQAVSFGDASRIYIRGADSRMTALYVDGVRVDSQDGWQLGGGVPWELVPLSQIERLEVLRGAASAIYGSDAMGGVVQIFTRRGTAGATPSLDISLGSMNTRKISAGLSGAQASFDYALGLALEHSDGYNTRPDVVHSPDREASSSKAASLRLGFRMAPTQRIELVALNSQLESHYVPWGGGTDAQANANLSSTAVRWESQWSTAYSTKLSLSRSEAAKRDDVLYDYRTTLQGILFENTLRLAGGTFSAVLEQKRDAFDSPFTDTYNQAFGGERTQNAVALGYGANYGAHLVQVNLRSDDDSNFGAHQTGAISYAYALTSEWRASASTGTAFRAPTLEQVFGPYGSAALAPETNHNSEVALGYVGATASAKAVLYHNQIRNMITTRPYSDACAFCYYNVGQATLRGLTLSGTQKIGAYALRASLDWLDPIDNSSGRDLSLRARRTMTLGLDRSVANWQIGADVQAVGERFDDAANTTVLPGYALLNFNAATHLSRDWQLIVRLDNAADAQYQQVGHFATPGRTIYAGFQWRPKN